MQHVLSETLGRAIVAGLVDEEVSGVQRFMQMESLAEKQLARTFDAVADVLGTDLQVAASPR